MAEWDRYAPWHNGVRLTHGAEDSARDYFPGAGSSVASECKKSDIKLTEISGMFSA